ncbi:MAG TPA: sigma 54-interacting transcriptional regulator [Candidatus Krumholzibacteria bacterium]|nr:sigma 54-interacting transcriptional regulator [Candidatus Krumholzibacteria bacterium]
MTTKRHIDEDAAFRAIVGATASATGTDFYRALVTNLSKTLDTHGAWVTEYNPATERLRAIAFWMGGQWVEDYDYPIEGTACETAIREKRLLHVPDSVGVLYPKEKLDPMFSMVKSYLGVPMLDDRGAVLGHVAVVDDRPMPDEEHLIPLFKIFAVRAAAEMRRLRLESAVREREVKLTRLIDSAMDAIVEMDRELRITMMNPAAEKVFGSSAARVRGQRIEHLVGVESSRELARFVDELADRRDGERQLWIPGIFTPRPPGGEPFLAEATLSSYEAQGKPFFTMILRNVTDRVTAELRIENLAAQTEYLRAEIEEDHGFDEIAGKSPALRAALQAVAQVADTDATVLIQGETGTGKELFARAIHKRSRRHAGPLIKVNCAAIPATLMESEFFGHEKGAFTGATQRREGRFAVADGGTIFLDEIGELPLELQGKLLRVLQEGEFEPVGGSKTRKVNVRVVAATNRDLDQAVKNGTFREDLYYRLSVFPLRLPPLRERDDDVIVIAETLVRTLARRMGRREKDISPPAAQVLRSYPWPGNVRELRNVIERALITSGDGPLRFDHILPGAGERREEQAVTGVSTPVEIMDDQRLRQVERANMMAALEKTGWRVGGKDGAAQLVGISPSTFKSRMKTLGIRRPARG